MCESSSFFRPLLILSQTFPPPKEHACQTYNRRDNNLILRCAAKAFLSLSLSLPYHANWFLPILAPPPRAPLPSPPSLLLQNIHYSSHHKRLQVPRAQLQFTTLSAHLSLSLSFPLPAPVTGSHVDRFSIRGRLCTSYARPPPSPFCTCRLFSSGPPAPTSFATRRGLVRFLFPHLPQSFSLRSTSSD